MDIAATVRRAGGSARHLGGLDATSAIAHLRGQHPRTPTDAQAELNGAPQNERAAIMLPVEYFPLRDRGRGSGLPFDEHHVALLADHRQQCEDQQKHRETEQHA
jgi:hypothetical protein